jgi:hypothetical protein
VPQKLIDLSHFFLSHVPDNTGSLVGVTAVFFGFWALGRLIVGRSTAESALAGWSLTYLVCVLAAVAGLNDFRWIGALLLILVLGAVLIGRKALLPGRNGAIALALLLPVVLAGLFMPLLHWDSYWHWVLNGSYLYWFNHFPAAPLDGFPSFHPTYPMATSLVYYFSSKLMGRFLEPAGLFMNLMLTVIALDCVIRLLRELAPRETGMSETGALYRYGLPVIALCIVLTVNPSFRVVNYFSAIADPALGVIVLLTIVRWCAFMGAPRSDADRTAEIKRDLLLLFLLGVLIGGVKHSGWALTFILSVAGVFVGIVRRVPWRRWLTPAVAVFSGTLFAHVLWSVYLSSHLAIPDQFGIQPLSQWRFDMLPALLKGMWADYKVEWFYYSLIILTVLAGWGALLSRSLVKHERLAMLLGFVAVAMPIHFASLVMAYLGTGFNEMEIAKAASLHRYSSHIGFAVCTFGMAAIVWAVLRYAANAGIALTTRRVAIAALALYAIPLGLNILLPSVYAGSFYFKNYKGLSDSAAMIAERVIPPHESVAIFGPDWAILFGSYHSWRLTNPALGPVFKDRKIVASAADLPSADQYLKRWMADKSIDHIWLFDAEVLNTALGTEHSRHILWSRSTGTWRVIEEGPGRMERVVAIPPKLALNP